MAIDPSTLLQFAGSGGLAGKSFFDNYDQAHQQAQQDQVFQYQMSQAQQAQAAAQQKQQQVLAAQTAYNADPSHENLVKLAVAAPEHAEALYKGASMLDADAKQSQMTVNGQLFNLAADGAPDQLADHVSQLIAAEKKSGVDTSNAQGILDSLNSGDPDRIAQARKAVTAEARLNLSVLGAKGFEIDPDAGDDNKPFTLDAGQTRYDSSGKVIASAGPKATEPHYEKVDVFDKYGTKIGEKIVQVGGGDSASSGSAPSSGGGALGGDTSRLINSDAGGGYVPPSVQTLGQFVNFGKSLNAKGAKSSSAGTYQINGSTMAQFAPKALGPNWQSTPFNADSQDKVGQAIFDWAKQQPNPAQALKNRWVSLSAPQAAQLVQGDWSQARSVIAQGETGGAPSASANAGRNVSGNVVYDSTAGQSGTSDPTLNIKPGNDATIPADIRSTVKAIANGQMAQPTSFALTKPYWQSVMQAVSQYDPTFDSSTQPQRVAAAKAFTGNGKAAQAVASINRLAYHMNDLYRDSQALTGVNLGPLSGLANATAQSFEKAAVARYNATLPFIAGELQKLTKNGQATEGESKQIMANLGPTQPASARLSAFQQLAELAQGQFKPVRDQWESAFPDGRPMPMDVAPETDTIFDHINNDKGPVSVDGKTGKIVGNVAPGASSAIGAPPSGGKQIGTYHGKAVFQLPNGKRVVAQ